MTSPQTHAVAADFVFDGMSLRRDFAVIVEGAGIRDLIPARNLPPEIPRHALPRGAWLAPGFIDVQVNGGGDVLFNDCPTVDGIAAIVSAHLRSGTTSILPTLITDTNAKMRAARDAVASFMAQEPGVLGVHFEGPFLSPEKAGVHDAALMRMPEPHHLELLTSLEDGVTLVTLAPERVPRSLVRDLAKEGVRVSLGHSMASYTETMAAIEDGLTGFTHLFNAMRPMSAREPGPIAAALESSAVWYGLIVDGHHVAPPMLKLALKGEGHPMLVTDAMPPVNGERADFELLGRKIEVKDARCVTKDGRLAGSCIDMATAVRNCVRLLGVPLIDALRLASLSPARFLGVDDRVGRLASGFNADMIALDPGHVRVTDVWVAGAHRPS
jgi:N-acetylglucosamine-6-phosphate deacetylase